MQRDRMLLDEMIQACERAQVIVDGVSAQMLTRDWRALGALSWQFMIIGESARQLSPELRAAHPHIPWRRAIDLRNLITHQYWQIDSAILHSTATDNLGPLMEDLRQLLADLPDTD